jgi:hypothetical protein
MSVEDAGTIAAQIRLELSQMEKDALIAQNKMDGLAGKMKVKGELAGKGFADGTKKGWDQSVGKIEASMASLGPFGAKVGAKIATGLSKPVIAVIPKMAVAFRSLQAAMGSIMIVIGLVTSAVMAIKGFIDKQNQAAKEAKEKQEALNKQLKETESNYKNITSSLSDMGIATAGVNLNISHQVKLIGSGAEAQERQAKNQEKLNLIIGKTAQELKDIAIMYGNITRNIGESTSREVYRDAVLNQELDALRAAGELEKVRVLEAERAVDYESEKLGYLDKAVQALQAQYDQTVLIEGANASGMRESLFFAMQEAERQRERVKLRQEELAVLVKNRTMEENIEDARKKAIEKYELAVLKATDLYKAGLIDEIELQKQKDAALATQYADLEAITLQYKDATGKAKEQLDITTRLRNKTAELVKENQDNANLEKNREERGKIFIDQQDELLKQAIAQKAALAQSAKTEDEKNKLLDEAINLENELIEAQRKRAREALIQSDAYKSASNSERETILNNFDAITEGMMKLKEKAKKGGSGNWLADVLGISSEKLGYAIQVGEAAISAFSSISDSMLEISRQHAEEQIALIEKTLKKTLENIEKERKARLIAAGFAVENNAESLEAQLEAAKRTGDEVLIYQTERRLEEQRINDEFDAQAKAAQEQAAREKAEIEYQMAKADHENKMTQAILAGIMAVLQALQSAPPPYNFILAGLSGAAAGVQIDLMRKNPPKPPRFANSGIVPGNKFSGDRVNALVDSGELILNRAHQKNIAQQLTSSGTVNATIVVMMDSREIAQSTVNLVNDCIYTINARAIR